MDCIKSNANKINIDRIKKEISDRCPKSRYNFEANKSGNEVCLGEVKMVTVDFKISDNNG